ncbi:PEP-CTERM domain protein [Oopsacas minuta]|uniref:PEP-CTERM domain protein n=1 Tax=Oopsacas minuta TaxID=111878 RepID=A0AAV7JK10_9METZ|nr:PEP-CTERM domain protein [Oopsacas minuta]
MATANYELIEENGDYFELELGRVKEKIHTAFNQLISDLRKRESELLKELNEILASYHSYKSEHKKLSKMKGRLENIKSFHNKELTSSGHNALRKQIQKTIDNKLGSFKMLTRPRVVSFECDRDMVLEEAIKLFRLVDKLPSRVDYTSKNQPELSICDRGNGIDQLYWPHGVAVDIKTGNIYVVNLWSNSVKVFDSTGRYLFKFGDGKGEGKMNKPRYISIFEEIVLISQSNNCILNYRLDGKYISRFGEYGEGKMEFNVPSGLAFNELNEDIYICDYSNDRIQIITKEFLFKSQFGKCTLKQPRDVKLSEEYIYVLDSSNPCIHIFDHNHILQSSGISLGPGMQVINPLYFWLDCSNNILISDYQSNFVVIFNPQFDYMHKIQVSASPMGITLDSQDRMIVVCQAENNCLQIF